MLKIVYKCDRLDILPNFCELFVDTWQKFTYIHTMKQKQIAKILGVRKSYVSMILHRDPAKRRPVSTPLAKKLSHLFPFKREQMWKNATPEEIKAAFNQFEGSK